jgi:ATP-dependent RNA helicase DeaD
MSDTIEEKTNPFLTPIQIIEPKNKLPDYTFDQLPSLQKEVLTAHGWTDLMPVQRKTIPYMLNARDMLIQSKRDLAKREPLFSLYYKSLNQRICFHKPLF